MFDLLSSLFFNRLMFSRWVKNIKTNKIIKNIVCSSLLKNKYTGIERLATNDDRDEYLEKKKTNIHDMQKINP